MKKEKQIYEIDTEHFDVEIPKGKTIVKVILLQDYLKKIEKIDEIFSEGFYNYFHNMYGSDDTNLNDKMIKDIDKKVKRLKRHLSTQADGSG